MRIVDGYIILNEHTIFLPRCNECEYSESGGRYLKELGIVIFEIQLQKQMNFAPVARKPRAPR